MARLQSESFKTTDLLIAQRRHEDAMHQKQMARVRIERLERRLADCKYRVAQATGAFERMSSLGGADMCVSRQAKSYRSFSRKRAFRSLSAVRDARHDLRVCRRLLKDEQKNLKKCLLALEQAKLRQAEAMELYSRPVFMISA